MLNYAGLIKTADTHNDIYDNVIASESSLAICETTQLTQPTMGYQMGILHVSEMNT